MQTKSAEKISDLHNFWPSSSFGNLIPDKKVQNNPKQSRLTKFKDFIIHHPSTRSDLCVSDSRVKLISNWFSELADKPKFLLLTGPNGCGKTATINILSKESERIVTTWNPDSVELDDNLYIRNGDNMSSLRNFLLRAGKYSIVTEFYNSKKLILIKSLPYAIIEKKDEFISILRRYMLSNSHPLVFIFSQDSESKDDAPYRKVFSPEICNEFAITHVNFNALSYTALNKALTRILRLNNVIAEEYDSLLCNICNTVGGDLHKAISQLVFHVTDFEKSSANSLSNKRRVKGSSSLKRTVSSKKPKLKEEVVGLFHTVGRVLYAKRDSSIPELKGENLRGELSYKPLAISDQYVHVANQFVHLIHSNFLDIFSSIDSIAEACEHLSDADYITDWRDKDLELIGFSVAVAGVMNSSNNPVSKWKPLKGCDKHQSIISSKKSLEFSRGIFKNCSVSLTQFRVDILPCLSAMFDRTHYCSYKFLPHDERKIIKQVKCWEELLHKRESQPPTPVVQGKNVTDDEINIAEEDLELFIEDSD